MNPPFSSSVIRKFITPLNAIILLVALLLLTFIVFKISDPDDHYFELNISCFTYRDVNRDGRYDVGDRPYAGLKIEVERPDGDTTSVRSNISGFANFGMLLDSEDAEIYSPGKHPIRAIFPDGWQNSSNNESQTFTFVKLEGSPTGLVAEQTCEPIGVMPVLEIRGRIELDGTDPPIEIRALWAVSPEGDEISINYSDDGRYSFPVTQGEWQLRMQTVDQRQWSRSSLVDDASVEVSAFIPDEMLTGSIDSPIRKVGFDDLTPSDTLFEVPNDYGRLNWVNWIATHQKFYFGSGYINATVSSEYMAYNSSGHPAVISSNKFFDFVGVYIGVAWPRAEKSYAVIQGWRGSELVYQDKIRLSTAGSRYFDADYRNITRLVFSTEKYWQLVIDEFEYRLSE